MDHLKHFVAQYSIEVLLPLTNINGNLGPIAIINSGIGIYPSTNKKIEKDK